MRRAQLIAIFFVGWAQTALAEEAPPAETFDAIVAEAMGHYQAHQFETAIELFTRAFEIRQESELIYNIARSYERSSQAEQAIEAYERFLGMPATTAELRTRTLANLSALRAEMAARERAEQPPEEGSPEVTEPPGGQEAEGSGGEFVVQPAQPSIWSSTLGIAGWALFGVGAVTAIVGVVFASMAISSNGEFEGAGLDQERLELRNDVERNALIADVLVFSGGGIGLAGIALLIANSVRHSRAGSEPEAPVAVLPGPRGTMGLGLQGRF
jgi:tetratricopeptide (TPR) repeat protein